MEEIKKRIKAVIFDMDGTIVDTERIWKQVTLDVLDHYGIQVSDAEKAHFLGQLAGIGLDNAIKIMKDTFNLQQSHEEIRKYKIVCADRHFAATVPFIDGFELFHRKLQQFSISTSIATNATPENLKQIDQRVGLGAFFGSNMYCVADVGYKAKPDPAVFLHSAEKLGVTPDQCIVFEDSMYGFQAAKAAGMKCIAIKNATNAHLLDQVHGAIDSYHEAEDALKKI